MPDSVADLLRALDLERLSQWRFRAKPQKTVLQRVFGGQVMAQCLAAVQHTVPADRWNHSLHGFFLRPGAVDVPIDYDVETLRDGRKFSTRRVTAWQQGKDIFSMIASFHESEPGFEHFDPMPTDVPEPETCPPLADVLGQQTEEGPERWKAEWGALDVRFAGSSGPQGTLNSSRHASRLRVWVRTTSPLPTDAALHQQLVTYASDVTLLASSIINHRVTYLSGAIQIASLDHAMWFHRPIRADDWWFYDQVSPSLKDARGIGQGRIFQDGRMAVLSVQEGLVRLVDPAALP